MDQRIFWCSASRQGAVKTSLQYSFMKRYFPRDTTFPGKMKRFAKTENSGKQLWCNQTYH